MIICASPKCQTTAGCQCARNGRPKRCEACNGHGWSWQLPNGMNAFGMRIEAITAHSRRIDCYVCHGEGTTGQASDAKNHSSEAMK